MNERLEAGGVYSAGAMNDFIGGKHQGGIRYSGNFPDLKRIGVVIGGGADAIYDDEVSIGGIIYVGEGQQGDQTLTYGNRALTWAQLQGMPVHVFVNRGKNRYEYLGPHGVVSVGVTIAQDKNETDRGVFVFGLRPTSQQKEDSG